MIVAVVVVRRDEDVDGLDRTLQELADPVLAGLEFDRSTVNSVDDGDGVATLYKHLAEYGLSPYADDFDAVDDDKGTIGDTESSRDSRRGVHESRGVNKFSQRLVAYGPVGLRAEISWV